MGELIRVASTSDIAPDAGIAIDVRGQRVAIFNVGGNYYAIGETCTHKGGPLSQGAIEGTGVVCPWHGARFELRTGEVLSPPAPRGVDSYKVVIEGNDIKLEV